MDNLAQLRALGLFEAKVPRYTSYPPANKFSNDVQAQGFSDWIAAIRPGSPVSLYLHVPFCRRLCWFCACRTQGVNSDDPVLAYFATLKQEIAQVGALLPEGVEVARLHWGGGTPTLLGPEATTDLANAVRQHFTMSDDAEFSVEIDPNEIDEARLDALAAAGMTRASIGVQDFDPEIQKTIGRIQSYEITRDAVEGLRARGVHSLNADILFGLPHQTREKIADSVQKLLSLNPDRVALYGYAHVPWMAKRQQLIPTDALPTPQERLDLFETAARLFSWDGYTQIGIDHFARAGDSLAQAARTGHLRRNFQGYTDDTCEVLIGLGASSISRFPQGFAQNAPATMTYQKAVRAGQLATGRGHVFKGEDRLRARLIEALMCDFRIDSHEILGADLTTPEHLETLYASAAAAFPEMVHHDASGFEILPPGRPLARLIARAFDAYEMQASSHSSAI